MYTQYWPAGTESGYVKKKVQESPSIPHVKHDKKPNTTNQTLFLPLHQQCLPLLDQFGCPQTTGRRQTLVSKQMQFGQKPLDKHIKLVLDKTKSMIMTENLEEEEEYQKQLKEVKSTSGSQPFCVKQNHRAMVRCRTTDEEGGRVRND